MLILCLVLWFFFSSRRRHTRCALVTGVQTCALPIFGAFGYCFGGTTVLELARSGADIAAVVTFHGGLDTSMPATKDSFKPSVLVFNGADDKGTETGRGSGRERGCQNV